MKKIYKDLFDLQGISGYEHKVRDYVKKHFNKKTNNIDQDKLGSVYVVKEGPEGSPVLMICAHMDEVGMLIVGITNRGMLKLRPFGGQQAEVFLSQQMDVVTKKGVIPGVIGAIPIHLGGEKKISTVDDLLIDIGASSKEEAISMGVEVGDFATPTNIYRKTSTNRILSKSIDDRWGVGLVLEIFDETFYKDLNCTLIYALSVQEEVGLRGAETLVKKLKPDCFIAFDSSPVNGVNFINEEIGDLGKGYLLRIHDPNNIMNLKLKDLFIKLSNKYKIKYQPFFSKGGTDAAKALIQNEGIFSTTIGLPSRYIHSSCAMMDISDHLECKKIALRFIKNFNKDVLNNLKKF